MDRILIVEDEEKLARFLELELAHEGDVYKRQSLMRSMPSESDCITSVLANLSTTSPGRKSDSE